MLFCSPSSPLHDRLMGELETIESCVEVVTAEMAALCCVLQQHKKNVSLSLVLNIVMSVSNVIALFFMKKSSAGNFVNLS